MRGGAADLIPDAPRQAQKLSAPFALPTGRLLSKSASVEVRNSVTKVEAVLDGNNPTILLQHERRDQVGESPAASNVAKSGVGMAKAEVRLPFDEVTVGDIELQREAVAILFLQAGDFNKAKGQLDVIGWMERIIHSATDPFKRVHLQQASAFLGGELRDPGEFVEVLERQGEDDSERYACVADMAEFPPRSRQSALQAAQSIVVLRRAVDADRQQ